MRSRTAGTALLATCALGALGTGATGAATHTMVPRDCIHEAFKPHRLLIACADGGLYVTGMHWSRWARKVAVGTGTGHINDCSPSCAMGHFHKATVRVRLSSAHFCHDMGVTQFRRLRLTWVNGPPTDSPGTVAVPVACPVSQA